VLSKFLPVVVRAALPLGILVVGWAAFSILSGRPEAPKAPEAEKPPIRTKVTGLKVQDYTVTIKTHGEIQPHTEIVVSAQVSGRITRISPAFEDGAFFSEGDVLVELEPDDYQTAVALAEARLQAAQAAFQLATMNHQRNLEFLADNLIAEAEVDQSQATLSQAEAEVNTSTNQLVRAQRDLARTNIRAPFDGRVRRRNVGQGQLVGPGTPLGTVFAVDYAEVRLPIAGRELPFLDLPESSDDPPLEVELRDAIAEDSQTTWTARIVRSEGALNEDSLQLFAIARVEDPFGRKSGAPALRIGQPVTGSIRGRMLTNIIALPRRAVRKLDQIYLVNNALLILETQTVHAIWSDEEVVIVRDPSLTNGYSLATTHLVYAPHDAKVEIIPNIEMMSTNVAYYITATVSNMATVISNATATVSNITVTATNITAKVQTSSKKKS
jgi:RND family efflux transporter MFP subunit